MGGRRGEEQLESEYTVGGVNIGYGDRIMSGGMVNTKDVHEIKSAVLDDELELTNNGKQQL